MFFQSAVMPSEGEMELIDLPISLALSQRLY